MAKKGALCSSLFISRRTSSASISSFCIKGLKYFGKPFGSCMNLSKVVSYLARSFMIERKLPLVSFESSSLDPRKGKLHFANINVTFTSLSKTFCQKFVFSSKDLCNAFSIVSLFLHSSYMTHTRQHDVLSFHGFEFAATNACSYLNLLYPKGFEVRKKSLERHFHEK